MSSDTTLLEAAGRGDLNLVKELIARDKASLKTRDKASIKTEDEVG